MPPSAAWRKRKKIHQPQHALGKAIRRYQLTALAGKEITVPELWALMDPGCRQGMGPSRRQAEGYSHLLLSRSYSNVL